MEEEDSAGGEDEEEEEGKGEEEGNVEVMSMSIHDVTIAGGTAAASLSRAVTALLSMSVTRSYNGARGSNGTAAVERGTAARSAAAWYML